MADPMPNLKRLAKRAVTENLGLKLVALVIAVVLFTVVRSQEKVERWIDLEVIVKAPPPTTGVVMTSETPDKVRVFLHGRDSAIQAIKKGEPRQVVMDVSQRREAGSFTFIFEREILEIPPSIEVVNIEPESVLVRMERINTRRLPVRVKTFGRLKPGTELEGQPVVQPADVTAVGAATIVRSLPSIETEEIDVEGLPVGEHKVRVPLRRIEGLEYRHEGDVAVSLKVRWTPGQRMISGLLLRVVGTEQPVEVRPAEVAVALSGPQVALDKLDPASVVPEIVLNDELLTGAGVATVDVNVTGLPEDVKLSSVVPKTVLVKASVPQKQPKKAGGAAQ